MSAASSPGSNKLRGVRGFRARRSLSPARHICPSRVFHARIPRRVEACGRSAWRRVWWWAADSLTVTVSWPPRNLVPRACVANIDNIWILFGYYLFVKPRRSFIDGECLKRCNFMYCVFMHHSGCVQSTCQSNESMSASNSLEANRLRALNRVLLL